MKSSKFQNLRFRFTLICVCLAIGPLIIVCVIVGLRGFDTIVVSQVNLPPIIKLMFHPLSQVN